MRRHLFVIRSSFQAVELSRRRLEIAKATCIPALKNQINKNFEIVLRVSNRDPLLDERLAAFQSIDVPVHTSHVEAPYSLVTRLDDDDAVSIEFVQQVGQVAAKKTSGVISFRNGILFDSGCWYAWDFPGNMFQSLICSATQDVFRQSHRAMAELSDATIIDGPPMWVWVRHSSTITQSLAGYKNGGRIKFPKEQFPGVSFAKVMEISKADLSLVSG
jgi:hypothetical protein